jgi:hypothetical protein
MRFLLIAVLSLGAWFGPVSESAAQVQPQSVVSAVSIWFAPLVPGTVLDPSDPQVLDKSSAGLVFTSISYGETLLPWSYPGLVDSRTR